MSRYPNPFADEMNLQNSTQILLFTYQDWNPNQTISKWPEIQYLLFQYEDNTEYQFIGRSLMSRYPNHFADEMNLQNSTQILPFTYQDWTPDQTISKLPEIQYLVFQ